VLGGATSAPPPSQQVRLSGRTSSLDPLKVIRVITEPEVIDKILAHPERTDGNFPFEGWGPPEGGGSSRGGDMPRGSNRAEAGR
jgi:hypothetical protein